MEQASFRWHIPLQLKKKTGDGTQRPTHKGTRLTVLA